MGAFSVRTPVIQISTLLLLAMAAASLAKADEPTKMEQLYLDHLQSWLDEGADPTTVQDRVLEPCSKLVLLTATAAEKMSFLAGQHMDEYDFRASFCMEATVNKVHPQPQFQNREMVNKICAEPIRSIKLVCAKYQLK